MVFLKMIGTKCHPVTMLNLENSNTICLRIIFFKIHISSNSLINIIIQLIFKAIKLSNKEQKYCIRSSLKQWWPRMKHEMRLTFIFHSIAAGVVLTLTASSCSAVATMFCDTELTRVVIKENLRRRKGERIAEILTINTVTITLPSKYH